MESSYDADILNLKVDPLGSDEFMFSENETMSLLDNEPLSPSMMEGEFTPGSSASPQPEKKPEPQPKPAKKRKSWGQELPTPTTNLPPRKRAKTEAEKEQRRIERVLRNRAAAQSSRERKRKEVQALEDQKALLEESNDLLKSRLTIAEQQNQALGQQLKEMEERISQYENYMRVARQVAAAAGKESSPLAPLDEPVPIKEEDPFLFVHSEVADLQNTLDPNTLFSESSPDNLAQSPEATGSLSMTHQSAALMCDLQCLQRDPTPETWTRLCGGWMGLLLAWFLQASMITIPATLIPLFSNLLDLVKSNPLQASLSNLSSISNKLNTQLLQRLQTCSQALAHHSQVATGSALRLESAKNASVQFCSGSSSDLDESPKNSKTGSAATGEVTSYGPNGWYVDGSDFMNLLSWENG